MASSSWTSNGPALPLEDASSQSRRMSADDRHRKSQQRQRLSCTKCRERKVKCDRTKPCAACCARGHPKDCEFVVGEGNDYSQIQQSYEIRKLRAEVQRLKERLQSPRYMQSGDDDEEDPFADHKAAQPTSRAAASRQRRFRTGDRIDNLYFGTPGLASVVHDFGNLQIRRDGCDSLVHTLPRGRDMYAPGETLSAYPFPLLTQGHTSVELARNLLIPSDDVFACIEMFQQRAQACYSPGISDEVTKQAVQRFLADIDNNAERFPDMLALIFATMATGLQVGVYERSGGQWTLGAVEASRRRSDVYIAASMQALRNASFLNSPTLLVIQTLVLVGPYLTNSGRFLDAWTLFGTTIRAAHSIGLHRDPRLLDPPPPLRDSIARRTLWWWLLHMDQQYSVTLGRPLGISGVGDCPPPEPLTTNPAMLRLTEFVDHLTILARQILSSDGMFNISKIDEFSDRLLTLWDTMPEALQFNEAWQEQDYKLPEWPLELMSANLYVKIQSFLILLNRQRVERTQANTREPSPAASMGPPGRPLSSYSQSGPAFHALGLRGRARVIHSSIAILHVFLFFHHRNPAMLICWTMGQQAYNACMILLLDAWETDSHQNEYLIDKAYVVFTELDRNGVHKLAELAVRRLSEGVLQWRRRTEKRSRAAMSRRPSAPSSYHSHLALTIDTTAMPVLSNDTVMGNTGMFLLEDQGLQSHSAPAFPPLGWDTTHSVLISNTSEAPTSNDPSPTLSAGQVASRAQFPVMNSSAFLSPTTPSLTPTSYALDHSAAMLLTSRPPSNPGGTQPVAFTPINPNLRAGSGSTLSLQQQQQQHEQQQPFYHIRGPRPHGGSRYTSTAAGAGPRGIHRVERLVKSQQRRK